MNNDDLWHPRCRHCGSTDIEWAIPVTKGELNYRVLGLNSDGRLEVEYDTTDVDETDDQNAYFWCVQCDHLL